jgi:predicted acyltransferase
MTKPVRLAALDAFRGFTILAMIMVNNPGSWSHIYAPLRHAEWHGCTPTDLIFPNFLFIVGMAMWYSFKKFNYELSRPLVIKILRRTLLIFLLGIFLGWFPFFKVIPGEGIEWMSISNLRILGVLQRIAIAYCIGSFIVLTMKPRSIIYLSAFILLAYWFVLWFWGGNDPYSLEGNIARIIDFKILGENHVWRGLGVPFDPEGLLSTLPAIVTVIIGFLSGKVITSTDNKERMVLHLLLLGLAGVLGGLIWNMAFPINKSLWTSSYVIYTGGLALLTLGVFIWLMDIKGYKKWAQPFIVYGMNPLFIYVLAGVVARGMIFLIRFKTEDGTIMHSKTWLYEHIFQPAFGDINGSLLYAVMLIVIYWAVGLYLYRKKIFIKI